VFEISHSKEMKDTLWLKVLVFFSVLFALTYVVKGIYFAPKVAQESFSTQDRFVLKRNQDVYDDFYAQVYRDVMAPPSRLKQETNLIIEMTQPSKEASVVLDLGSGTGDTLDEWLSRGFQQVYGIELQPSMVSACSHPNLVLTSDFMKRDNFEPGTFTHILCMNKTMYEIDNKVGFFKNVYSWLKPGGYLVLHLFEIPRPNGSTRIPVKTKDVTQGWLYESALEMQPESCLFIEQFTQPDTARMRLQERNVFYKEMGSVLNDAMYTGFIVHGKASVETPGAWSPREYIYFLQK